MSDEKYKNENQELRAKRQQKYAEKTIRRVPLGFHVVNDKDILDKLDSVDNVQGYIKGLIRNDIENT